MAKTPEFTRQHVSRRAWLIAVAGGSVATLASACGFPVEVQPTIAVPTVTFEPTIPPTLAAEPSLSPTIAVEPTLPALPTHPPATAEPTVISTAVSKPQADFVLSLNPAEQLGNIDRDMIGFGLDKRLDWLNNDLLPRAIRDTRAGIVRFGSAQNALWNLAPREQPKNVGVIIEHTLALGRRIRESGAKPLCIITGYPDGFRETDWVRYGREFVAPLIRRCAEEGVVLDFELWNESDIETDDGKFAALSTEDYRALAKTVVPMMREANPHSVIYGPAAPHKDSHLIPLGLQEKLFDVMTHHNYAPPVTAQNMDSLIEYARQNYQRDLGNKIAMHPRWGITEYNASPTYDFGPFQNPDARTEQYAGMYYMLASYFGWSVAAECMIIYALDEAGASPVQALAPKGIYRRRVDALKVLGQNVGSTFIKTIEGRAVDIHPQNSNLQYISSIDATGDNAQIVIMNTHLERQVSLGIDVVGQTPAEAQVSYFSQSRAYAMENVQAPGGRVPISLEGLSAVGVTIPVRRIA